MPRELDDAQRATVRLMLQAGTAVPSARGNVKAVLSAIQYYIRCRWGVHVEAREIRAALKEYYLHKQYGGK